MFTMTLHILEELLEGYLKSLLDEGIVNDQFSNIEASKSTKGSDFVVQSIQTYFADIDQLLSELTSFSKNPDLDFPKLASLSRNLKDLSSSIGAEQVGLACADLVQACDQMHKSNFCMRLILLKNEFGKTRDKLDAYIQMVRRIMRVETKQQN